MDRNTKYIIGFLLAFFLLTCCCICITAFGAWSFIIDELEIDYNSDHSDSEYVAPTPDPMDMPDPPTEIEENISVLNLSNIQNSVVSEFDVTDAARMFMGITDIPEFYIDEDAPYDVGDEQRFWLIDTDTNVSFETDMTLRYETEHVYFWIENGVVYDEDDLKELVETFENEIYPTNREFFGSEFYPGIDNDPHIFIIFAGGLGRSVGGLFSSSDSIHPVAQDYSNGHETFYINADNQNLSDDYTYGVLSHEFQHMIHWYLDRNETSWLNEGFSELAVLLNEQDPGYFDYYFLQNPDMQLNTWPDDDTTTAHYGSSLLFVTYFYDRMGVDVTKALVAHTDNGLDSIDNLMIELDIVDELTGEVVKADELVLDWAVTNYLLDDAVEDGRYDYYSYEPNGSAPITTEIDECSEMDMSQTVNQYGADYIKIRCGEGQTISFSGNQLVDLLPEKAYSGDYSFWTNQGDESKMTLTRFFDFTEYEGDISFTYNIWYDIEEDYDYLYLVTSPDGEDWEIIETPSGTDDDPSGNNYGWGYNGFSGDGGEWINEKVDLSEYAGQEVYIGFLYLTDAGVNGEGALIDNVYIPEIGYEQDFENGVGDWEADGFVLVSDQIPQSFELALIRLGSETSVERLALSPENTVEFEMEAYERVILVVVGTTRYTHQPAVYNLSVID